MKSIKKIAAVSLAALMLTACASNGQQEHEHDHEHESGHSYDSSAPADAKEVSTLTRRAVIAYDGGLLTLNLATGETIADEKVEGFLRLNQAGDNRHLLVSDSDKFRVFDGGLLAERHDDHYHYYESKPYLTDISYDAPKAGHVTAHAGVTGLFSDGEGTAQFIETEHIADKDAKIVKHETGAGHHGVAVALEDGTFFSTQGTDDHREVLQIIKDGKVVKETDNCPGSHGETVAEPTDKGDVVVMGCTNGPFVYRDGEFHKVSVTDEYARTGNLAGSEESPIVLGDYKVDPDVYPERTTRVSLIDTRADSLKLVELGSSYWFRSLGRGPAGEALVLTYDGNLNVIDEETGEITKRVPVISEWQEKDEWQLPGPILKVSGSFGYITDAVKKELVVLDLTNYEELNRFQLDNQAVEMEIVTGK